MSTNPFSENRFGTFRITVDAVTADPALIQRVMGECIITRCEFSIARQLFEYEAWSPRFDVCPRTMTPPEYMWETSTNGSVVDVRAVKQS